MPHESTVEHTGELFQPTPSSAMAPRGYSFSDDTPSPVNGRGSTASLTSSNSVFGMNHYDPAQVSYSLGNSSDDDDVDESKEN